MPYAADVYTLPPGTDASTLTPIDSSDYNAFTADIAQAQNAARPIVAGGTGGQTAADARTNLGVLGLAGGTLTGVLSVNMGSAEFPAMGFRAIASSHATSRRAGVQIGDWFVAQDSNGDGVKNLFLYNGTVQPLAIHPTTGTVDLPLGQIGFPGVQNPSSNANVLDDYEEGTFTPALSATGCTFSYASQVGTYTKIGNRVYCEFRIELNTSGNTLAANALSITGLPFANGSTVSANTPIFWNFSTTSYVSMTGVMAAAGTTMAVHGLTAAGAASGVALLATTALHATNGSLLRGQFSYKV